MNQARVWAAFLRPLQIVNQSPIRRALCLSIYMYRQRNNRWTGSASVRVLSRVVAKVGSKKLGHLAPLAVHCGQETNRCATLKQVQLLRPIRV